MRKTLTDKGVLALKPRPTRYHFADPQMSGHMIRVLPSGTKTFAVVARDPGGAQIWATVGGCDVLKIDESRESARAIIRRIKAGLPPQESPPVPPDSFKATAESWLRRHVEKNRLRTQVEIERVLNVYVYPDWADRPFTEIRRRDIAALLDRIEDERGSRMADITFGIMRSIANWFSTRNDDYLSPFNARGQRRSSGAKRSRILDDSELRAVWKGADRSGGFGSLVKTLLLTGQRRGAVLGMRWDDIKNGTWTIATEAREKINAGSLKLPAQVLQIIDAQPRLASNPYVFAASRGRGPMNGFSRAKVSFDKKCGVEGWTMHDLRPCARSLLARCDVRPDIAEATLGHVIAGIEGRYNVHQYDNEKAVALAKLAALVDAIVDPDRRGNVVPMTQISKQKK